jgi:hypothetical protein
MTRRRLLLAIAVVALTGCSTRTTVPRVASGPEPTTSQNAVKLFEWAVVNRDVESLEPLFTADFAFVSVGTDSAGNPSREVLGGRDWVLAVFRCMLDGGADGPPVARVSLTFDRNLRPQRDPRAGYQDHDSLYKTIRTSFDLSIDIGDGSTFEVTGYALFFLVRGDVAVIPDELQARGLEPDRNRWWISRWEDETIAWEGMRFGADPTKNVTLGAILRLYEGCP